MANDEGECRFHADFNTNKVTITMRAPLAINRTSVAIPIAELLEIAAQITVEAYANARAVVQAQMRRDIGFPPKEAHKPA